MSANKGLINVNWVVSETASSAFEAEIQNADGMITHSPSPFVPPIDELEDYQDAQFEPLIVISTMIAIGFLIKRISDVWLDHKRPGGLIVDARGKELVVRPAPHIPRGTLLVIKKSGSTLYKPEQKDSALETLGSLAKSF